MQVTAVLPTILALKDEIINTISIAVDELDQILSKSLNQYVINYGEKYGKTKTFLRRDSNIDFNSIYFPLSVSDKSKNKIRIESQADEFFKSKHFITVLGMAGSGKTMILKRLFLSTLEKSCQIPIVVELRKLNTTNQNLYDYISEEIFGLDLTKNGKILERFLRTGKFTFFLDGFDELSLNKKSERINEIEKMVDRFPLNNYLLTSRPSPGAENLSRFENMNVEPLSTKEIEQFVSLQLRDQEDGNILIDKINKTIKSTKNESYRDFLKNPLLLSMFILTYNSYPELPSRRSDFYYNVFETLYSRHDTVTKTGGFIHDKKSHLEKSQFVEILKRFSYISYMDSHFTFDIFYAKKQLDKVIKQIGLHCSSDDVFYDLTVSISIMIKDGLEYMFPHRSLQEYFIAILISDQTEQVKKEKIYVPNFMQRFGVRGDYNLWHLCEEIDSYYFYKYFMLGQSQEIYKSLTAGIEGNDNDKFLIFLNMAKIFDIKLFFSIEGRIASSRFHLGDNKDVFLYNKFYEYMSFSLWKGAPLLFETIKPYLKKDDAKNQNVLEFTNITINTEIKDKLEKSGILSAAVITLNKIKDYIDKALKVIESKENSLFSLD